MNAVIARQNGDAGDGGAGAGGGDAATAAAEAGAEARLVFDAAFVVFDSIGAISNGSGFSHKIAEIKNYVKKCHDCTTPRTRRSSRGRDANG